MKILVVSNLYPPDFLGGYELGCRQAVDALRAAGHEVLVLTAAPRRAIAFDGAEPHILRRLHLTDLYDNQTHLATSLAGHRQRHLDAHGVSAFNVHALCEALESFQPDVAYLWNLIGLGGLGLIAALQHTGTPWVMHLMDNVPLTLCEMLPTVKVAALQRAFLQLCRGRFIGCSQTVVNEIAAGGLPLGQRTTLIPNWVEAMDSPPLRDYRPGGILRIVSSGTLSHSKGTHLLIEAAARLRDRGYADFTIDLFGHCSDPQYESMILARGLADCVRYCGVRPQAELLASYSHYDAFAFPTREREPFGFAPLEAAAFGCVPLVSDLCGFAEWFLHGVDCLKVPRDAESWAEALASLLDGTVPLAALGSRAAHVIHRDFRLETLLPRIVGVLERAIGETTAPRRSAEEAYRLAILAERSFYCLIQELAA